MHQEPNKTAFIVIKQKVYVDPAEESFCPQNSGLHKKMFGKVVYAETKEGALLQVAMELGKLAEVQNVNGFLLFADDEGWQYSTPDIEEGGWKNFEADT